MHDSEQEHSGITGCRVTYESTIFYNEANKFSIIVVKTNDPRIPPQACSGRYYGDRMLRFTAVGYELPRTKAVELELDLFPSRNSASAPRRCRKPCSR